MVPLKGRGWGRDEGPLRSLDADPLETRLEGLLGTAIVVIVAVVVVVAGFGDISLDLLLLPFSDVRHLPCRESALRRPCRRHRRIRRRPRPGHCHGRAALAAPFSSPTVAALGVSQLDVRRRAVRRSETALRRLVRPLGVGVAAGPVCPRAAFGDLETLDSHSAEEGADGR